MLLDYILLVIEDIRRRKISSFLTLIAISLGILAIYSIISISQGFETSLEKQFEELGTNRIIIQPAGKELSENEVDILTQRPYVQDAYGYIIDNLQLQLGNEFVGKMILGASLSEEFFSDLNVNIEEGRFPRSNEKYSIVVGPNAADNLFSKEIKVGSNIYINNTKFKVVGITESIGNPEDDSNVYISQDAMRDITDSPERVDMIMTKITPGYEVNLAAENIKIILENKLGKDSVNVQTFEQLLGQVNDILNIVQLTLGGIAFVSLIVGAFGIINTMYVIVTEKIKEIGIMKSVGATNEVILFMYMFQAGFFGLLGAIIGIILGILASYGFEQFANAAGFTFLDIVVDPVVVSGLLIFGFIIGILSGYLPAKRASGIIIVEALRK